jgi:hypothetical protein
MQDGRRGWLSWFGSDYRRDEVQHLGELDFDHLLIGVERCRRSVPDADRYGSSPPQ